jgi:N-acetylglutamate synthase-like GNAT family acetyltransferase
MKTKIEHAIPKDADTLTQIAFAAKSFWGYPEEYLKLWQNDLIITADYIQENTVLKAVNEKEETLGFGAIEFSTAFNAHEIGHMWVHPKYMGNGLGHLLINALINHAQEIGITQLYSVSDPNAQGFYEKMGFKLKSQQASLPKGRYLPVLVLETRKIAPLN